MYCFAGSITQLENYYAKGSRIIILSNYENNSDLSHVFFVSRYLRFYTYKKIISLIY